MVHGKKQPVFIIAKFLNPRKNFEFLDILKRKFEILEQTELEPLPTNKSVGQSKVFVSNPHISCI